MKKLNIIFVLFITIGLTSISPIQAGRKRCSFGTSKSYAKKTPYSGFGKQSKVNGSPKTKSISGHAKRTKRGYTYVNPYSRSK